MSLSLCHVSLLQQCLVTFIFVNQQCMIKRCLLFVGGWCFVGVVVFLFGLVGFFFFKEIDLAKICFVLFLLKSNSEHRQRLVKLSSTWNLCPASYHHLYYLSGNLDGYIRSLQDSILSLKKIIIIFFPFPSK